MSQSKTGKKSGGGDSARASQASTGALGSTKSILDRFRPLNAQYVRRTETLGMTLLLEVGIPGQGGTPVFYPLTAAEAMLQKAKPSGAPPPPPPMAIGSSTAGPSKKAKAAAPDNSHLNPVQVANWADEVENSISAASSGGAKVAPPPERASSPKGKKGKGPKAPPTPDFEVRAAQRLGMTLSSAQSLPAHRKQLAMNILGMSQKEYNLFRAHEAQTTQSRKEVPAIGPSATVAVAGGPDNGNVAEPSSGTVPPGTSDSGGHPQPEDEAVAPEPDQGEPSSPGPAVGPPSGLSGSRFAPSANQDGSVPAPGIGEWSKITAGRGRGRGLW
jgi:hypothetical protein